MAPFALLNTEFVTADSVSVTLAGMFTVPLVLVKPCLSAVNVVLTLTFSVPLWRTRSS